MPTPQEEYEATIATLSKDFREQLTSNAHRLNACPDGLLKAVVTDMLGEDARADGRAHAWRVRLALYNYAQGLDEPEADSDTELEPGQPGVAIIRGIPAVMKYIAEAASEYHNAACVGLDQKTLKRKSASLRTMMSYRKDGTGTLRADYEVNTANGTRYMLARCDIMQVDKGEQPARRKLPGGRWMT